MRYLWLSWLLLCSAVLAVEPAVVEPTSAPHIALLLPLKSPAFRAPAGAVQQGFLAASSLNKKGLPVRVYSCVDEGKEIVGLYAQALSKGARVVVGPLTRNGVNLLAAQGNISVPTLTLNTLESQGNDALYGFGMSLENEARMVAQLAAAQGLQRAVVIGGSGQFSIRMQLAFEDAWHEEGGTLSREIAFNGDVSTVADLVHETKTLIFLAVNAQQASVLRPYLPNRMPVYATSQLFVTTAPTNFEFNGFTFVDMPWLIQPNLPLVQSFPRAVPALPLDLERLYALGIDAYRLSQVLLSKEINHNFALDGVSGQIQLNDHQFQRLAVPATFVQGQAQVLGATPAEPEVSSPAVVPVRP